MKLTNKYGLPQAFVAAITEDRYSRGASKVSMTQLIGSPRISILQQRHSHDLEQDVSEKFWSLFGRMCHDVFERYAEGDDKVVTEERLFAEVSGWVVSGAMDRIVFKESGTVGIQDYKMTTARAVMDEKVEWERQLNGYAWLVKTVCGSPDAPVVVDSLEIVAVVRDWSRTMAAQNPDYPQSPSLVIAQKVWSDEEQERFVRDRVRVFQEAEAADMLGEELPECSDEERWVKPTTWAAMKPGGKRASKVAETREEIAAWVAEKIAEATKKKPEFEIVERRGENTRCQLYCAAAPFCSQWQRIKPAEEADQGE